MNNITNYINESTDNLNLYVVEEEDGEITVFARCMNEAEALKAYAKLMRMEVDELYEPKVTQITDKGILFYFNEDGEPKAVAKQLKKIL